MRIDAKLLRFLSTEQFRVLVAIEMGMKNHELVPTPLIQQITCLRSSGFHDILGTLLRMKLIRHDSKVYDGYELNYHGYDFLALRTFVKRGFLLGLGRQIGIGKESDIYVCHSPTSTTCEDSLVNVEENDETALRERRFSEEFGTRRRGVPTRDAEEREEESGDSDISDTDTDTDAVPLPAALVIKFQRLGRTSFRAVKSKRDYLRHRSGFGNWLYLSRLASQREYTIMQILWANNFPCPRPIDWNRHCVMMTLCEEGVPLDHVHAVADVQDAYVLFEVLLRLVVKFAENGLIHCDFNEFNVLIVPDSSPVKYWVIDFPQMVSTRHPNAQELYRRDIECILIFFERRFGLLWPPGSEDIEEKGEEDEAGEGEEEGEEDEAEGEGESSPKEPVFQIPELLSDIPIVKHLDVEMEASGFDPQLQREFKRMQRELRRCAGGDKESSGEMEGEGRRQDERKMIRTRLRRQVERERLKRSVRKSATKKARKGRNRRRFWASQN